MRIIVAGVGYKGYNKLIGGVLDGVEYLSELDFFQSSRIGIDLPINYSCYRT